MMLRLNLHIHEKEAKNMMIALMRKRKEEE
jgi:hypothetical protein